MKKTTLAGFALVLIATQVLADNGYTDRVSGQNAIRDYQQPGTQVIQAPGEYSHRAGNATTSNFEIRNAGDSHRIEVRPGDRLISGPNAGSYGSGVR